jgi:hypothetical protein
MCPFLLAQLAQTSLALAKIMTGVLEEDDDEDGEFEELEAPEKKKKGKAKAKAKTKSERKPRKSKKGKGKSAETIDDAIEEPSTPPMKPSTPPFVLVSPMHHVPMEQGDLPTSPRIPVHDDATKSDEFEEFSDFDSNRSNNSLSIPSSHGSSTLMVPESWTKTLPLGGDISMASSSSQSSAAGKSCVASNVQKLTRRYR